MIIVTPTHKKEYFTENGIDYVKIDYLNAEGKTTGWYQDTKKNHDNAQAFWEKHENDLWYSALNNK